MSGVGEDGGHGRGPDPPRRGQRGDPGAGPDRAAGAGLRRTVASPDGSDLEAELGTFAPDLVVLDVMLPGRDGFELLPLVRRGSRAAVMMLTARDAVADRVAGLGAGADDYVVKPFAMAELVARVHAVLRRTRPGGSATAVGRPDPQRRRHVGSPGRAARRAHRHRAPPARLPRRAPGPRGQQDSDPHRGVGLRGLRRERRRGARLVAAPQARGRRRTSAGPHRARPRLPARRGRRESAAPPSRSGSASSRP